MVFRFPFPMRGAWFPGSGAAGCRRAIAGVCALWLGATVSAARSAAQPQESNTPRILFTESVRAVDYQLARLTNDELVRLERRAEDARYRPVYYALLTRRGLLREYREEALAALTKMDKTTRARVLLQALARVPAEDTVTGDGLIRLTLAEPASALRQERGLLDQTAAKTGAPSAVLQAAYGALMVGDASREAAWQAAVGRTGHLAALVGSVPHLPAGPAGDALRTQLFAPIASLAVQAPDAVLGRQAVLALPWLRRDGEVFRLLARAAAERLGEDDFWSATAALALIPEASWPQGEIEPLARAVVAAIGQTPAARRTEPGVLHAVHLGERLAAVLPTDVGRAIRRDLRALAVRVVRIEAIREQMLFDVRWFAVEAGRPVRLVFSNPDTMPHNVVIGAPGSLQTVGAAAAAMSLPTDPAAKAFVPVTPLVVAATRLIAEGETDQLAFTAPRTPGEYVFSCTFPGHWVRMYGVMVVVDDLDSWESQRTVPSDPVSGQPLGAANNSRP
jgi:azurin